MVLNFSWVLDHFENLIKCVDTFFPLENTYLYVYNKGDWQIT